MLLFYSILVWNRYADGAEPQEYHVSSLFVEIYMLD